MIHSKQDLKYYLNQDKLALHYSDDDKPSIIKDEFWKWEILLRKNEYVTNCLSNIIWFPYRAWIKYRYHKCSVKLGFTVPLNCFGPGLSIAHYGTITIGNAKVGRNCRLQEGVNIGSTGGSKKAATIGDNVFIGTGAKIIGDISIANNCVIGANSVVVKSINENGITVAGVPAKKISENDSKTFIDDRLDS